MVFGMFDFLRDCDSFMVVQRISLLRMAAQTFDNIHQDIMVPLKNWLITSLCSCFP